MNSTLPNADLVQGTEIIKPNNRRGNPNWHKGMKSANPKGQALGHEYLQTIFKRSFQLDKDKNKQDLIEYAFEVARKDNNVLVALLRKLLPDLLKQEGLTLTVNTPPVINFIAVYKTKEDNHVVPNGAEGSPTTQH